MISKNTLELLEFHKLLIIISQKANSDVSEKALLNIIPMHSRQDIERRFGQIQELRALFSSGSPLRLTRFADIFQFIERVRPQGAVLEAYELAPFIPVLGMAIEISDALTGKEGYPYLSALTEELTGHHEILGMLTRSVDADGSIRDNASSALLNLRQEIKRLEYNIQKKLEKMMRDSTLSVFLQDDFITKRSGRWVIPVRMDSKGQVSGVVHDISKSGETAFIEPLNILNLSNELENLIAEEKAEEIRILRTLSEGVRLKADEIEKEYKIIIYLDILNSIALCAEEFRMQAPQLNDSGLIHLVEARHPLLARAFQKAAGRQQVVPLDVRLGEDETVMVITGSNAGGKTITIKTIGLLVLMALSGIPVPADSSSSIPLVQNVLIDIGDEQSIETSLSTFSAHISNISAILKRADSRTLILIDELGTGTDPDEGAALSCAILRAIQKSGASVFATTHLTGIKGFVHRTEGMLNAAMEFDQETLTPLYRLRIGEPGQSHALEIAQRYGLPENIISSAKELFGGAKIDFDNLIADLNKKRAEYEKRLEDLSQRQLEIDRKTEQIEVKLSEVKREHKRILSDAYGDAADIVSDIKRRMYAELDAVKKMEKEKIRESIKKVEEQQRIIADKRKEFTGDDEITLQIDEIDKGDVLYIKSLGSDAEVIEIIPKQNRVRVSAGSLEIEVPLSDLGCKRGKIRLLKDTASAYGDDTDKSVSSRIHLLGLRVDEALSRLEPFLNHAALAGLQEVTIIHGVGKGILAQAIHDHLDGHPLVKKFRFGELSEGGRGVTVVILA